ncbi:MAG TPA: TIM barrel protein [Candidatus Paceibacterota bacterium]|nr:TIM barrel protein [Verrucomicrobiota bacterium]HRY51092.1 TIM barrel protein [Candidatus Paceibacterota bacterium]
MSKFLIGNAPCSWGTLEFEGTGGEPIGFSRMLDELAETGYAGTELGDWGFMPTDPPVLRQELSRRGLVMLGAFVPVALKESSALSDGIAKSLKIARLLAAVATEPAPFLVLADNNGTVPLRTQRAGRITPEESLSPNDWKIFAAGAEAVARAVRSETGLRTVFHHHCAGYVETHQEIATLLELTDPQTLGLVFDTGHYTYGSGGADAVEALGQFRERVWYVHLKDCHPGVAADAREKGWDYFEALRQGVFCELGKGSVDFPRVLRRLAEENYAGWMLVEQDVLPGMGSPKESARRNRDYLASIEHYFTQPR